MQQLLIQSSWNTVLVQSNPPQSSAASVHAIHVCECVRVCVYLPVCLFWRSWTLIKRKKERRFMLENQMLQPSLPSHSYVGLGTGTQGQGWSRKGCEL